MQLLQDNYALHTGMKYKVYDLRKKHLSWLIMPVQEANPNDIKKQYEKKREKNNNKYNIILYSNIISCI